MNSLSFGAKIRIILRLKTRVKLQIFGEFLINFFTLLCSHISFRILESLSLRGIQTLQKENFLSPKLFPFSFRMRQKPIIGLGLATSQSVLIA